MAWHYLQLTVFTLLGLMGRIEGHGRMLVPPGRPGAFREGFDVPPDYTDNGYNCGGMFHQWGELDGKCGICGDPFDMPQPRNAENGGKFGKGVIVREYVQAQVIQIKIDLTAAHKGYFEFRICKLEDTSQPATLDCLNQHLLATTAGQTRYPAGNIAMVHTIAARLPRDLTCDHCVLQWKYHAGNSWGQDASGSGIGYGPQEEFYGCADIRIRQWEDLGDKVPSTPPPVPSTTPQPSTTTTATYTQATGTGTIPPTNLTTTTVPVVTADPDLKFKCQFAYTTGKEELDTELDELCTCACNRNQGLCDNSLCFCYEKE